MEVNDLVEYHFQELGGVKQVFYGVVENSNANTLTVRWENGTRQRIPRSWGPKPVVDTDRRAEMRVTLGLTRR